MSGHTHIHTLTHICTYTHTYTHTHIHVHTTTSLCACAPRVNKLLLHTIVPDYHVSIVQSNAKSAVLQLAFDDDYIQHSCYVFEGTQWT